MKLCMEFVEKRSHQQTYFTCTFCLMPLELVSVITRHQGHPFFWTHHLGVVMHEVEH